MLSYLQPDGGVRNEVNNLDAENMAHAGAGSTTAAYES
jgi:hypothetical protein